MLGMGSVRFAHAADIHIGGFPGRALREREEEAVSTFVERCLEDRVDFVVLAGDTFDSNIPPIREAIMFSRQMKRLRDAGVRVYAVYGSHDFSPTRDSLIELLEADGVITVVNGPVTDRSGVLVNGLHGLVGAKEVYRFGEPGLAATSKPSVFVFHTAVYEANMVPREQSVPISSLPAGYNYYAAGHLHRRIEMRTAEGAPLNYPGPLFLGWGKGDLENYFRGADTGFYIVDIAGDGEAGFEYVPVRAIRGGLVEVCADNKSAEEVLAEVEGEIQKCVEGLPEGSVILVKIYGRLSEGKRASVSVGVERLRRRLSGYVFEVNDRQLAEPEEVEVESGEDFEVRALEKLAAEFPVKVDRGFVERLIQALGEEQPEGMNRGDYQEQIGARLAELLREVLGGGVLD